MGVIKIEKNNRKLLQSSPIVLQINTELLHRYASEKLSFYCTGKVCGLLKLLIF
jgi:hypothetical protein